MSVAARFTNTTSADTAYTPPQRAIWINGVLRYCVAPSGFHGNPVSRLDRTYSEPAQTAAPSSMSARFLHQVAAPNRRVHAANTTAMGMK